VKVVAESGRLSLRSGSVVVPLEQAGGDTFVATAFDWNYFPLLFSRADIPSASRGKGQVMELAYGSDWYTKASYTGPRSFPAPSEFHSFTGFYQSDSAWSGGVRIVLRKGGLWVDGASPLQPIGNAIFRMGDEPFGPDTAEFHYVVEGKAQLLKMNGADFWRVAMD
jgi:hypothetical protein